MNNALEQTDAIDAIDSITAKASQLRGLLVMMTGEGFEQFSGMTGDLQHNTLYLASELAGEIGRLVPTIRQADAPTEQCRTINAPNELELVQEIENGIGLHGAALQGFVDLNAMFEAIASAAPDNSLVNRLAVAGMNASETLTDEFTRYIDRASATVEEMFVALNLGEYRRFPNAEQSSPVMEGA
jgi:hypothetical protein